MMKYLLLTLFLFVAAQAHASLIRGTVTNQKGDRLPFATVMIKGTTNGVTTNADGLYQLEVAAGAYTIICQYMGYRKMEKPVQAGEAPVQLDFVLEPLSMQIKEVVIKSGGEDPAYAIIRQAIKKRSFYQSQLKKYTVDTYMKLLAKMRRMPKKVFGQKIDTDEIGVDSTGKGIFGLSESVTRVNYDAPNTKLDVLSSRQSGGGLGFSIPATISFYDNNVEAITSQLGPRGFISPISQNALLYYKYRLEGTFLDDNKLVNKIKVIPRRKYEPLFAGYIYITEDDWRIHSTDLMLTKEYQLELIDTLIIRQTHVPVTPEVWRTKDQVVYIALKMFGFDLVANSVQVYSNYNLHPVFPKGFFNKVIMRYEKDAGDRNVKYWDSIRPVPLEADEAKDFRVKDSTARARRDSARSKYHLDSLRKKPQPVKLDDIALNGWGHTWYFKSDTTIRTHRFHMRSLLSGLSYNTVEGLSVAVEPGVTFSLRNRRVLNWTNNIRYGFSNSHLNAYTSLRLFGNNEDGFGSRNVWTLSGGKKVQQFNRENPIGPVMNSLYTLLLKENYMKLYEAWFGKAQFSRNFQNAMQLSADVTYEDRIPLENTTDFVLFKDGKKTFTPNHPQELAHLPFVREQVLAASVGLRYQPGQRFIEYPRYRQAIGSDYPTFSFQYTKGFLDADFDKWKFGVRGDKNFKLFGAVQYNVSAGGFLNSKKVSIPDLQHFNGNQTFYNIKYVNSFQLAPYYQYSTSAGLYATYNIEHHFNGLLTNKIPLFNRLKWNLVAGSNAFYVNRANNYVEVFAGLENIFKVIRVDVVAGYQSQADTRVGVRIGFGGILGSAFKFE
ncbi:carboxypeptidase-like regulatory domain-containing protein [Chitinophaga lutea]|uniref:Carboxypeptidase-like regulatory domain-containing protein n=1 Tax=Chitinophaga lutea TaxID=2488634 RepID=A0A3N4PI28_9BACT|nr:DUF5686 and carboxypeptidase regulatory-like domain-containing protein [Chitinophaga lutea]RPE08342.1 carboxypeptidase-like regulatory domain-containing protein [Chitinophaga lutea]